MVTRDFDSAMLLNLHEAHLRGRFQAENLLVVILKKTISLKFCESKHYREIGVLIIGKIFLIYSRETYLFSS